MILLEQTLLSEEVFDEHFVCDLAACKGACCVEGESGAPLEEGEIAKIEEVFEAVRPLLSAEALAEIERTGFFEVDDDGDFVTPTVGGRACVYATFNANGTAKCAFERVWREGKSDFPKPISCHLYPVRVRTLPDYVALNYHRWPICDAARTCGAAHKVSVLEFCRTALERRFGAEWYRDAADALAVWRAERP
jgi:hypothetical protein